MCCTSLRRRVVVLQALAVGVSWSELRLALEVMFEGTEGAGTMPVVGTSSPTRHGDEQGQGVSVGGLVNVTYVPGDAGSGSGARVVLEWEGGAEGDMMADAVVAVLLQASTFCNCNKMVCFRRDSEVSTASHLHPNAWWSKRLHLQTTYPTYAASLLHITVILPCYAKLLHRARRYRQHSKAFALPYAYRITIPWTEALFCLLVHVSLLQLPMCPCVCAGGG